MLKLTHISSESLPDYHYKYHLVSVLESLNSNLKGSGPIDDAEFEIDMVYWLKYRISVWEQNQGIDIHFYNAAIELIDIYEKIYILEMYK